MKVDIHSLTVESPDSKHPATSVHEDKTQVKIALLDNYADDDQEFLDFLVQMDPFVAQAPIHEMPLDQLIQRLESFYSLTIYHDVQVVEVALPVVDPTTMTEYVAQVRHDRWRANRQAMGLPVAEDFDKPWEDLGALFKQEAKQACVVDLYDVLHALTAQGAIGGIARG